MSIVLAVDVGNSCNKVGMFRFDSVDGLPTCLHSLSVRADEPFPWSEIDRWPEWSGESESHSVIATTNPRHLARVLDSWPSERPQPRQIASSTDLSLQLDLLEPSRVGIDRVLNAVAANRVRVAGQPVVIVDSGTATTVDVVTSEGVFAGGAILPGFELAARSLHRYTALLPLIAIDELHGAEPPPIGKETRGALRSGLFWGQIGAIKELVSQMSRVAFPSSGGEIDTILTGGGAELLRPHFPQARFAPNLALQGLALTCCAE